MNADETQQLKTIYRDFLMTERGRADLKIALRLKKEWQEEKINDPLGLGITSTAGVNPKFIHKKLRGAIKKVKITPIGLNNLCHTNSEILAVLGYSPVLGYNITACRCGRRISYELHSLSKKNNEFYDFTRDFNDETEKYFLPFITNLHYRQYVNLYGTNYSSTDKGCRCSITWNDEDRPLITDEDLLGHLETIKNMNVIRMTGK